MADDWDLTAVVRSCKSTTATTDHTASNDADETVSFLSSLTFQDKNDHFSSPKNNINNTSQYETVHDQYKSTNNNAFQELEQFFYKPHFSHNPTTTVNGSSATNTIIPNSLIPDFGRSSGQHQVPYHRPHQQMQYRHFRPTRKGVVLPSAQFAPRLQEAQPADTQKKSSPILVPRPIPRGYFPMNRPNVQTSTIPRPRKRRIQQNKLVCTVTKENLYSDLWAWRKYGQKPIKGSPYPRNYYRCSSIKGCSARKQVERSQKNPELFVLTYTGEHSHPRPSHRNSLAGTTRAKVLPPPPPAALLASCSLPQFAASSRKLSPTTPLSAPHVIVEDEIIAAANGPAANLGGDNGIDNKKKLMDEEEEEEGEEEDDDDDDDDDVLIPNVVISDEFLYDMLI